MVSILDEIKKLRKENEFQVDINNTNKYRIVINENDGSKTAYYFSTPIYNYKTKHLLNLKYQKLGNQILYYGSNSEIIFRDNTITMENENFNCAILLKKSIVFNNEKQLICIKDKILPTTNGFVYKANCDGNNYFSFELIANSSFVKISSNNKYFSLNNEYNNPLITISCVGAAEYNGNIISPSKIKYEKINDDKFLITVTACSPMAKWNLFEVNLYEQKLIQDTTVESNNPTENNVFGGIAFLGQSHEFGEQWLYSKIDYSKMLDVFNLNTQKILLHLPQHNNFALNLCANKPTVRFCSFGSNWDNKVPTFRENEIKSILNNGYQTFDLTQYYTDKYHRFVETTGITIKGQNGFSVITTGDSYYAPPIFEVKTK